MLGVEISASFIFKINFNSNANLAWHDGQRIALVLPVALCFSNEALISIHNTLVLLIYLKS